MKLKNKTKRALIWINKIFKKKKIPFEIWGGFAAEVYGAERKLADIDIFTHNKEISRLYPLLKHHKIYGPKVYRYKPFHILLLTINYKGQEIDICGLENLEMYDKFRKHWFKERIKIKNAIRENIAGIDIRVMPKKELLKYKRKIGRKVDLIDVKEILK